MNSPTRWTPWALLPALLSLACGAPRPSGPGLQGFSERRISIELREVKASNFFRLVGEAARTEVQVEACAAERTIDIRMKNAPLRLVVEAVGLQLGLAYQFDGQRLRVGCQG